MKRGIEAPSLGGYRLVPVTIKVQEDDLKSATSGPAPNSTVDDYSHDLVVNKFLWPKRARVSVDESEAGPVNLQFALICWRVRWCINAAAIDVGVRGHKEMGGTEDLAQRAARAERERDECGGEAAGEEGDPGAMLSGEKNTCRRCHKNEVNGVGSSKLQHRRLPEEYGTYTIQILFLGASRWKQDFWYASSPSSVTVATFCVWLQPYSETGYIPR
ncbi:hypothetical protein B0H16DRAFT_1476423 [Mycena metata]|uniref:Uncharacterized protein n=1 Tax=Mycena metata TaxID=1033252 RepID=A0AAD7HCH8_9AGAR|nr:hypothetical protein B0H16DRAFT_1476423 [Mycena metata]